ncbi:MAG: tRNA (adenosine(37)-N6)-dimethylallyltransferase MiaA [Reichenbachiella sp.]
MNKKGILVVIVGPTGVGKTAISLDIAEHFDTEIISADSRQFFREMEIGTAKPTLEERARVPHHMVDSHSIVDDYDAGAFGSDANKLLDELFDQHQCVVMVGGSGLYVRSVCEGLDDMPDIPDELRDELKSELENNGLENLLIELEAKDPIYFDKIDKGNGQRIIRALEVIKMSGRPYTEFRKLEKLALERPYEIIKIGIEAERPLLYDRINHRMDLMIEAGLFEEAERLYPHRHVNALQTVGYKEIFDYLDGKYDKEEAIRLLKRNSRRYAKRQLTWFKKDETTQWFTLADKDKVIQLITQAAG